MQAQLLTDAPIKSVDQDQIGAARFARRLLQPLVDWPGGESFVLGLYGSWGTGKTSILNLLEQELSRWEGGTHPCRAIPVVFNPWMYSDTESLLLSFFGTLSVHTGKAPALTDNERQVLASALEGIAKFLVPFLTASGSPTHLGSLGNSTLRMAANKLLSSGEVDFRQARQAACEVLTRLSQREIPIRVVVLVDDLDRVQANEILAVLRVVRLIADLPNISYVLAMDYERVREVLAANRSSSYGEEFLEKIIQVPISVPPVPDLILDRLVKEAISAALKQAGHPTGGLFTELHWRIADYYNDGIPYHSTIAARICTLRDRARLVNNLQFMLLTGERKLDVHPADAVLISFLHTFYPDVYHRVRRNKLLLTRGGDPLLNMLDKKNPKLARRRVVQRILEGVPAAPVQLEDDQAVDVAFELHSGSERSMLHQVLLLLFPVLREEEGRRDTPDPRHFNRIASFDRFDRYFELEPPAWEVSDEYVDEFVIAFARELDVGGAGHADVSVVNSLGHLSAEERSSFVDKLLFRMPDLLAISKNGDSIQIGARGEAITRRLIGEGDFFSLEEIESILLSILMRIAEPRSDTAIRLSGEQARILRIAVESITDPAWAMLIGARFLNASETNREKEVIEVAELSLKRFQPFIDAHPNIFSEMSPREASHLLWRWRDLLRLCGREFSPIKKYLRKVVENDVAYLPSVVAHFGGWVSNDTLILSEANPAELRTAVDSVLGTDLLLEHCRRSKALPPGEQPSDPHHLIDQCIQRLSGSTSTLGNT